MTGTPTAEHAGPTSSIAAPPTIQRSSWWVRRLLDRVEYWMLVVASVLIASQTAVVIYSVFMRKLFDNGVPWAHDVAIYALQLSTFLSMPWLLRNNGHVKVTLPLDGLGPRFNMFRKAVVMSAGSLVATVMLVYGFLATRDAYLSGSLTLDSLTVPRWWLLWCIPLAGALLLCDFVSEVPGTLLRKKSRDDPRTESSE